MLQQFKNKYYKYWYILVYSFKQSNVSLSKFLIFRIASVLQFCLTIYVWLLFKSDKSIITYLFVGYIIQRLVWTDILYYLPRIIFNSEIKNILLLPTNFTLYLFVREIGSRVLPNLLTAAIMLLFIPFFQNQLLFPNHIFYFVIPLLLTIGFCTDFFFSLILGLLTFWFRDTIYSSMELFSTLTRILTGILIPFQFLPSPLKDILPFNPYAWMSFHPMQIYLGNYNSSQILLTLLGGVGWIVILYFISQFVFKLGLKRYESEGL